jgi:hypothetical protein
MKIIYTNRIEYIINKMLCIPSLGAINKNTNKYIHARIANKIDKYICIECDKDLILCKGKIRNPYFRDIITNKELNTFIDKNNLLTTLLKLQRRLKNIGAFNYRDGNVRGLKRIKINDTL